MDKQRFQILLLISVLLIATCGLIYELVAGTLSSYLLGDSVTQFSTVIGTYLFAMGIGSYLSRHIEGDLVRWFIRIELLVGLVGGFSSIALFAAFQYIGSFRLVLYSLVTLTGIFVGLEIPILMRIFNEQKVAFKDLVSRVFTFDYLGALLASLIFPLLLVPKLGLIRTSLLFGMMNIGMALFFLLVMQENRRKYYLLQVISWCVLGMMLAAFIFSNRIQNHMEQQSYNDPIIYSTNSKYQRIVLTMGKELRLYLNNNLQFSSRDEYRYHEALVHPAMISAKAQKNILILGGGDGLALREVFKYPQVEQVTLVDLDEELTGLFQRQPTLRTLNHSSLNDSRLKLVHADAFQWIRTCPETFDVVIIDFPDPSSYALGKLYSQTFYNALQQRLDSGSAVVVQSTSPYFAPNSFWCIDTTMASCGFLTEPYHCNVPSFGEWGFILGTNQEAKFNTGILPEGLKFFQSEDLPHLFHFPADMAKRPVEVNKLNNQILVSYFESDWKMAY